MTVTHCPRCRNPLAATQNIVPGFTVYCCRTCRKVAVDIPGTSLAWRDAGEGAVDLLRIEVDRVMQYERALRSSEDDPAWSSIA